MSLHRPDAPGWVEGIGMESWDGALYHPDSEVQAELSLSRVLARLDRDVPLYRDDPRWNRADWDAFVGRVEEHFTDLFLPLLDLYGRQFDFFHHLESVVVLGARLWMERAPDLKALDARRGSDPDWFQSERMVGGMLYVDLFAGTLAGVKTRIPYFRQLGLTYLHLMPVFSSPQGRSDGGYAVSDYRSVRSTLGAMEDLESLAADLRAAGISLVLDFVVNHTSDEHAWAAGARSGDRIHRDFYYTFVDRHVPDVLDSTLREIFPETRTGSFSWVPDMQRWVWTTFNSFQWDLNYRNPAVFLAMGEEMLRLANRGAEILRFDALAFVWKEAGTSSENLPRAHQVIRAFNALARMAAPSLLFKSEAIVHPDDVVSYVARDQCRLSYNPLLMALLWEALATREVALLRVSMADRFRLPDGCAWVNYVRSHDDIGWTFDDGDAARLGINPYDHRHFLNRFYTGRFPGSFARGLPFQENPRTGDARVSGTCASLAGLEAAVQAADVEGIELSVRRILLLYGVAMSIGGIPLIYLGDECGALNDYGFHSDPERAADSRWVHRPSAVASNRSLPTEAVRRDILARMQHLIAVRARTAALGGGLIEVFDTDNPHVFGYVRRHGGKRVVILANFSEVGQVVEPNVVRLYGSGYQYRDLLSDERIALDGTLDLSPYALLWLSPEDE